MPLETLFELGSGAALLAWAMLAFAVPLHPGTARRILLLWGGRLIPVLLSVTYLVLLVVHWRSAPGGGFGSLEGVAQLFASRGKLLGGWFHFLAFDLLVGRWMIDDAGPQARTRWVLAACLPLTFLYGPAGFLLYCAVTFRPGGAHGTTRTTLP